MALQFLLWLGVILLCLVVLFVSLPIHVALSWQSDPVMRSIVLLRPFGGAFPPIRVYDSTRKRKEKPAKPKTQAKPERKPERRGRGLSARGNLVAEAVTLLRRVFGAIHFDGLHLDAEFGLGDPAETGRVFGQLCPVIYGAGADVRLRPNFDRACFHGSALAQLRVTPLAIAWPFVGFGWRVFGPGR